VKQKTPTLSNTCFAPLGMEDTRFSPAKACGQHTMRGAAIALGSAAAGDVPVALSCRYVGTSLLSRVAPTARDDESRAIRAESRYDYLLRALCMTDGAAYGGVALACRRVFDDARCQHLAQALLDRLAAGRASFRGASDAGVDDDSAAAREIQLTTRRQRTTPPERRRNETEYDRSAARSELPAIKGQKPARLAGILIRPNPRREA